MRVYEGKRRDNRVIVTVTDTILGTTTVLQPQASLALANHSPTGFEWGYGGSGPAQLALALLLHYLPVPKVALALYMRFKDEFVSKWPEFGWIISEFEIDDWLKMQPWREVDHATLNASRSAS